MAGLKKKYQFVNWFPQWQGFAFHKNDPEKTNLALIYRWHFYFGFWEIRKWTPITEE